MDDAQNSRSIQRLAGPGAEHRSIWILDFANASLGALLIWRSGLFLYPDKSLHGANPDAPVFRSRTSKALDRSRVLRIVQEAAKRAGVEGDVSPHWLRHAHATHSLERGAPIHLLQATLGHASVATTSRYNAGASERVQRRVHRGGMRREFGKNELSGR